MRKLHLITAAVALAASLNLQAADINLSGNVVASACEVDSDSVSRSVNFGNNHNIDFKEAGTAGVWMPFDVKLINCPATTSRATLIFTGTPSQDDASMYANSANAQNIALQLAQNGDRSRLQGNGSSMTMEINAEGNATYALAGRLYSVNGNTTSGDFNSVVQLSFTYQ